MEHGPQPPLQEAWDSAAPETPEIIDLREPTGFDLLYERYKDNPEQLAFNTSLAMLVLVEETGNTLVSGQDASVLGQKSQMFIDSIAGALTADQKHLGYQHLLQRFSVYESCSVEFITDRLQTFRAEKNRYLANFQNFDSAESRAASRDSLKDILLLMKRMAGRYISDAFDRLPMSHEGGNMDGVDPDLFYDFLTQFALDDPHAEIPASNESDNGLNGQVRKRFVQEAHHLFGLLAPPLAEAWSE